jgi:hypothetical protein
MPGMPDDLPTIPFFPGFMSGLQQWSGAQPPTPPRWLASMPFNMSPELITALTQFSAGGAVPGGNGGTLLTFRDPRKARPEPLPLHVTDNQRPPYEISTLPFFQSPEYQQGIAALPGGQSAPPPTESNWLHNIFQGLLSFLGG